MGITECYEKCSCQGCTTFIIQNPGADAALLMGIVNVIIAVWNSTMQDQKDVPYLKPITATALALSGVALITFTTSLFAEAWALYKLKRESDEFGDEIELAIGTQDKRKDLGKQLATDVDNMRKRVKMLEELQENMSKVGSTGIGGMQRAMEMFQSNLELAEKNLSNVQKNMSVIVQTECASFNREITDFYRRKYLEMSENDEDWNVEVEEFEIFVMMMANSHHLRCFAKALEPHIISLKKREFTMFTKVGFTPSREEFKKVFHWLKLTSQTETSHEPDGFDGESFNEQVLPALCEYVTADFEKSICQDSPFKAHRRLSEIGITIDEDKSHLKKAL